MSHEKKSERSRADAIAKACMARYGWKRLALSRSFEALLRPLGNLVARKPVSPENEPQSILVAEYWHLGDIVMLTPFLRSLRQHYPRARITLLANPKVLPLLAAQKAKGKTARKPRAAAKPARTASNGTARRTATKPARKATGRGKKPAASKTVKARTASSRRPATP